MKMRNMSKNALAVAVGAGLVAAPVLSAQAYEFAISGHINRDIIQLDNGDQDSIFFADNGASGTRLRATGSGDYGTGKIGFFWEHGFGSNSSSGLDLPNTSQTSGDGMRHADIWFSYDWGKISIGRGSSAADGITEQDLGGTVWAGGVYAYPVDNLAGVTFVDSGGAPVGPTVGAAIDSFDPGREDRFRYDSPAFGPLTFAVSLGNGENSNFAVRGNHEFGQNKFVWGIGVRDDGDLGGTVVSPTGAIEPDDVDPSRTLGSASLGIGGWSFTVSFGEQDLDLPTPREDPEQTYFKVGYETDTGHSFGIGVGTYDDLAADGDEADITQFGWGYSPNESVDLYASYTEAELDRDPVAFPGLNLEDVTAILFGTRVKFK